MKARDACHLYGDMLYAPQRRWHNVLFGCMGAAVVVALIAFGAHLDAADDSSPETKQLAEAERKRLAMAAQHPMVLAAYEQGLVDATAVMQATAAMQASAASCDRQKGR